MKRTICLVALELLAEYNYNLATAYLKAQVLASPSLSRRYRVERHAFVAPWSGTDILDEIVARQPVLVGWSTYVWNAKLIAELSAALAERLPGVVQVLGGPEAMAEPVALERMFPAVDFFVHGEGELTFCALLDALAGDGGPERWAAIHGLSWRRGHEFVVNPERELLAELGELASPFLDEMAVELGDAPRKACIETMRGCPYACTFCHYAKGSRKVRYFPLERTLAELRKLRDCGCREIYLMDPTFNVSRERALQVLGEIASWERKPSVHLEMKAELITAELVEVMAKLHVHYLELGLQSSSASVMRLMKRSNRMDQFRQAMALLRAAGIGTEIHLIVGLAGQTESSFWSSLDEVIALDPCAVTVFRLLALPGTVVRAQAAELGLRYDEAPPYGVVETPMLSERDLSRMLVISHLIMRLWPHVRLVVRLAATALGRAPSSLLRAMVQGGDALPSRESIRALLPAGSIWDTLLELNLVFGRAYTDAERVGGPRLLSGLSAVAECSGISVRRLLTLEPLACIHVPARARVSV